jgi:transposase
MAIILAIDLGKYKSVACVYDVEAGEGKGFESLPTRPGALHDLIVERSPDRVVIETGNQAGWVKDLCEALGVEIEVANPNHEGWRWKHVKRKTDRDDALKLAKLSAVGQLPTVNLPDARTRQWRAVIAYRAKLVGRRTAIKCSIRSLLDRQGQWVAVGRGAWTVAGLEQLRALSLDLDEVDPDELWRGQLAMEVAALDQVRRMIKQVEAKLDALGETDARVARLRTIPGVGARLAELVVATLNDPKRFKSRREVAAYAGLVPRQFESGTMSRQGRITGAGQKLLRALLVEVSWMMKQHNPAMYTILEKTARGSKTRRKIAVVAMARRLLIVCWAMLRDETDWREPTTAAP